MEKRGILYGVGVGPGDPELVTLKALRIMQGCDCLLLPESEKTRCRAWQIAAGACPALKEKQALGFVFPMTRDKKKRDTALDGIWSALKPLLDAGKDLAFLTIGDPDIYSTYSYLAMRAARDGYRTEAVPGVPSFAACSASLRLPLAVEEEPLHLIPGDADWDLALAQPGTKVFMKLGCRMPALKAALLPREQAGELTVFAVSDCGRDERLVSGAENLPEDAPYMTTVIVMVRKA